MHSYAVRYSVEDWDKPIPAEELSNLRQEQPGICTVHETHGYADELFVASFVGDSVLLMGSDGRMHPSRRMLEAVQRAIAHHLEHHV